jgi:hypothetical protein
VHPVTAQMARENRQFLGRAVSYVAARGVRQFVDVGAGLPTVLNTHDIARHTEPDARVAYVDYDRCKPGCAHACWPVQMPDADTGVRTSDLLGMNEWQEGQ